MHYTGDDNCAASDSATFALVVTDSLEDCPAAPAIAAAYLRAHGVKPESEQGQNIVAEVAHQTGNGGDFFAKNACDPGYQDAVESYISDTYGI